MGWVGGCLGPKSLCSKNGLTRFSQWQSSFSHFGHFGRGGLLLRLLAVRMHPWLYLQTMPPKGAEVITESIIAREGPFRQQSLRMELQGL